MEDLYSHF
ncbi:putative inactive purple acid phosphatase 27, partial [Quercus suber]